YLGEHLQRTSRALHARGQRRGTARSPARLGRLTGRRLRWSSAVDTDESIAVRTRATTDSPPGPGRGQDTRAPGLGGMRRRDSERDHTARQRARQASLPVGVVPRLKRERRQEILYVRWMYKSLDVYGRCMYAHPT